MDRRHIPGSHSCIRTTTNNLTILKSNCEQHKSKHYHPTKLSLSPTCNTGVLRVSPYPYSWTVNTGNQSIRGSTAAAKSLQSCLTLCDPIDGSPPGSPIHGILQQEHRGYQTEPDKPFVLSSSLMQSTHT